MSLADETIPSSLKIMNVGKSGTGKTGALASLVIEDPEARLFVADYDLNGAQILTGLIALKPDGTPRPGARDILARVHVKQFKDPTRLVNGVPLLTGTPVAYSNLGNALNDWGGGLGGYSSWGPRDYLAVDSWTALSSSAMRNVTFRAGRANKRPYIEDWGAAQDSTGLLLELLCDPDIKANLIINNHVRYIGDVEGATDDKGKPIELDAYPNGVGSKQPQEIGRYFNNLIVTATEGEGRGLRRGIYTKSPNRIETKTSNPFAVKSSYSLETGLHELVTDLRKGHAALTGTAPPPAATAA